MADDPYAAAFETPRDPYAPAFAPSPSVDPYAQAFTPAQQAMASRYLSPEALTRLRAGQQPLQYFTEPAPTMFQGRTVMVPRALALLNPPVTREQLVGTTPQAHIQQLANISLLTPFIGRTAAPVAEVTAARTAAVGPTPALSRAAEPPPLLSMEGQPVTRARPLTAAEEAVTQTTQAITPQEIIAAQRPGETFAATHQRLIAERTATESVTPVVPPPGPRPPVMPLTPEAPMTVPILTQSFNRRVVGAAQELFTQAGVERAPGTKISDQITQLLGSKALSIPEMDGILQKYGMTFTDFANGVFRPAIADAGRRLQTLSALERQLNLLARKAGTPEEIGRLADVARQVDASVIGQSWWQRADQIRRGLLVTQLATAVRNFETQVGRVGMDTIQSTIDAGLQRAFGLPRTASPLEGLDALGNIFYNPRVTAADVESVLSKFPLAKDRLFNVYASDIATRAGESNIVLRGVDKALQGAQDAVGFLNTPNRVQEFLVRRAVFQASLAQRLRAQGRDLAQIIAENRTDDIPTAAVNASVQKALEITFAQQPVRGSISEAFVRLVNKAGPFLTSAIPFPRFLTNSLKFYFEFSPLGVLKLLSPVERAAFAAGNTQAISRAVIGTAMLGAAYQLRTSQYAGEKWYEAQLPSGKTIDLRPFNPFMSYLFVADMIRRKREGTLYNLNIQDVATALLSANVRAGTGLYLVDKALQQFANLGSAEQRIRALQTFAGTLAAGTLTGFQQVYDALAQFDASLRIQRETRTEPFLGPIKSKIPGLAQTLPEAQLPTRAGPGIRDEPLLRQATGITLNVPKNALEQELDRLQFTRQDILPSHGDPNADLLIAKYMGPLAEQAGVRLVQSVSYQRLRSDDAKRVVLKNVLAQVRGAATIAATRENPKLFLQIRLQNLPLEERRMLQQAPVR